MREASLDLRSASEFSRAAEVLCFAQDDWDVQAGEEAPSFDFAKLAMIEWKLPERQLLCQSPRDRQGLNLLSFSSLHIASLVGFGRWACRPQFVAPTSANKGRICGSGGWVGSIDVFKSIVSRSAR